MLLSGDIIYYWIHEKYPKSNHVLGRDQSTSYLVKRPMFWNYSQALNGHIVVLERDQTLQIVHHYGDTIFLTLEEEMPRSDTNEYIQIHESVSLSEIFNYLLDIFDLFSQWETQLEQAVGVSLSYDSIIRSCDPLLKDPLALTDVQYRYVSFSKKLAHEIGFDDKYGTNVLPLDTINILTALPGHKELEKLKHVYSNVGVENMLHKNVFHDGIYVGKLSILKKHDAAQNAYYSQILLVIARYVERLYSKLGTFRHRKQEDTRIKMMLISLIKGSVADTKTIYDQAVRLGHRDGDQYCLVELKSHFSSDEEKFNTVLSTHIEDMWPGCLGLTANNQFFILINLSEFSRRTATSFKEELSHFLKESLLIAGLSRNFSDLNTLQTAARQASAALEFGEQQDPLYWYFNFDDYAFLYLLNRGCHLFQPESVVAQEVLILSEYDSINGTELNRTLKTYIQNSYNAVSTAKELFIARSTFLNRLDRIEKLTHLDLKSFEKRAYLALSYILMDHFRFDHEHGMKEGEKSLDHKPTDGLK